MFVVKRAVDWFLLKKNFLLFDVNKLAYYGLGLSLTINC